MLDAQLVAHPPLEELVALVPIKCNGDFGSSARSVAALPGQ